MNHLTASPSEFHHAGIVPASASSSASSSPSSSVSSSASSSRSVLSVAAAVSEALGASGACDASPAPRGFSWESTETVAAGCNAKRETRFWLQDRLFELLPLGARECACHRASSKGGASVVLDSVSGQARYRGVYRCSNVWVCPLCAPVIAAKRSGEVCTVLNWGSSEGFRFLKLTFTCRHTKEDKLDDVLDRQVKALRSFKSSRSVRRIRESIGYVDSITAKEATWGAASGWHPHQHEYWMLNLPDGVDWRLVSKRLEEEWIKSLRHYELDGAMGVALHICLMKPEEIKSGSATGYLTKAGTAAGYLTKAGTAAAIEIVGGVFKQGDKKPHKKGHYSPMELLSKNEPWADKLFIEFYEAFKDRKQLTFGRVILAAYRELFGTVPGDDFEVVNQYEEKKSSESLVISLGPRQLYALRKAKQAVKVLRLVELGLVDEAVELIEKVWDEFVDAAYRKAVRFLGGRNVHLFGCAA